MSTSDWIGTSLSLFGIGFSLWAFMLSKAIQTLKEISTSLTAIDKRLAVLEQWREFRDEEFNLYRKHTSAL